MLYFWLAILTVCNTVWLGLTFLALPGNWLMVITTCLFAWLLADEQVFSVYTLLVITGLALTGELVEFIAGRTSAKKAGASGRGARGALLSAALPARFLAQS